MYYIPLNLPMRIYTLKKGRFAGDHYIFDSNTEAAELLSNRLSELNVNQQDLSDPITCFPHYSDGEIGDWVRSDDGWILQIQNIYRGTNAGREFIVLLLQVVS